MAVVPAAGLGVAIAPAGPASAAISTGRIQLCSQGNYASRWFYENADPANGNAFAGWVPAGECATLSVPRFGNIWRFSVQGRYNTSNDTFTMRYTNTGAEVLMTSQTSGRKFASLGTTAAGQHYWTEYPNV
ncbi:hypothetical protein [Streptomyces sp. NPDC004042]|uniref:hypothetical protein n=1 Tax=Streptomyces sp. NPDC004042 TaxID=3154451 RepID=UPI0033A2B809